ncbi:cation transporter [Nocardioides sp.]|uniref:cation transporter n=1 Tax=Nocardioides sp. TaxID=35761 RepID=UPI002C8ECFF2|nr:cation transporter [Nocardioides sp.]HXH80542.1 cation transporter [Nocardioides sp.]
MTTSPHAHPIVSAQRRSALNRRVRFLVAFTISYNLIEAAAALFAGTVANSSALIGFGLGSVVEVSSALAVAWQFAAPRPAEREKTALRIIALSFFGLATFVVYDALASLISQQAPAHSTLGIVIASLSLVIMPTVSLLQRRTGEEIGSHSAVADAKQTLLCSYMSAVLLLGLAANSLLGWWWADPVAALVIAALAVREGINAWNGDACCSAEALFEREDGCED